MRLDTCILSELETERDAGPAGIGDRDFSALELPTIIQDIVDDLQPLLSPYEAAFYWYAFRHSIVRDGNPHIRLSKTLRRGVVKSSYSTAVQNTISEDKYREVIGRLRRQMQSARRANLTEMERCTGFWSPMR